MLEARRHFIGYKNQSYFLAAMIFIMYVLQLVLTLNYYLGYAVDKNNNMLI